MSNYTIITADSHAGANHKTYREYLESKYHDDFDAWRGEYKNPFADLQEEDKSRMRNWDKDMRDEEQHADGIVAEVLFPNTVPPFFPTGALIARPPDKNDYERRLAGIRAHNRWLVDFCAESPDTRAGIGQIFLNNIDDALDDVNFIADNNLRGGILLPGVPDDTNIEPLFSNYYEPLWQLCAERGVVVNHHSGGGSPDYGDNPAAGIMFLCETTFYSKRALTHLMMSAVFERHPELQFVLTEQGYGWIPELLTRLDTYHRIMESGRIGELGFPAEVRTPLKPSEYFERQVWLGASFPGRNEAKVLDKVGVHKIMWGSDYPHHEGTYPFSVDSLRYAYSDRTEAELRQMLSENVAKVYNFDLAKLEDLANQHGPTVEHVATRLDDVPAKATSPAFYSK